MLVHFGVLITFQSEYSDEATISCMYKFLSLVILQTPALGIMPVHLLPNGSYKGHEMSSANYLLTRI